MQEGWIGTNPDYYDTDEDLITDTLEIRGYFDGTRTWYLDALEMDSNKDGQVDGLECQVEAGQLLCPDSDSDGTPDVFDLDNDGDFVPDKFDLSPFQHSGTFNRDQPFLLTIDDLTAGEPAYVEFQLRPTNARHLRYSSSVLDWPGNDSAGLVQDVDDKTFWDVNPTSPVSPNDNGDMRLVPMLEITIESGPDNPFGNLPVTSGQIDERELTRYGVSTNDLGSNRRVAYLPLQLVTDPKGGSQVAFSGKMFYRPESATWGQAHLLRMVWVVQGLVDNMGNTDNLTQILHTYDEEWQLTGLSVREDHGVETAVIFEDPGQYQQDSNLFRLAAGLDEAFLSGRDCDTTTPAGDCQSDGQRDLTVDEIQRRFNLGSAANSKERWGLPDAYRVETYAFDHQDEAMVSTAMTVTKPLLNQFTPYWSPAAPISPTLMFASEQRFRVVNLDMAGYDNNMRWTTDRALTVKMTGSGDDAVEEMTIVTLNWAPYRYDGVKWSSYPLSDYAEVLYRRYAENYDNDTEAVARGKTVSLVHYYVAMFTGNSNTVELGGTVINHIDDRLEKIEEQMADDALEVQLVGPVNVDSSRVLGEIRPQPDPPETLPGATG